jgi:hypothetical protein
MLGAALFVSLQSRDSWKQRTALERSKLELLLEHISADSCFMLEDYENAFLRYEELARRSGDTTLLSERRRSYESIDGHMRDDTPEEARNRLEEQLLRTERMLSRYKNMEEDLERGRELLAREEEQLREVYGDDVKAQQEELVRIRSELSQIRKRAVLRFASEKKGDSVIYLGEVENGKANGEGTGVWSTGSVYEGQWKNNLRHGRGIFNWADGEFYEGNYMNDLRDGFGVYHWKNGQRWEGQWKGDMRHGAGTLYEANGKVRVKGNWEADKLKGTVKE